MPNNSVSGTQDMPSSTWKPSNVRHIGMSISVAVIVYCFLYFIVLQNLVITNQALAENFNQTHNVIMMQDAMRADMKKEGIKTQESDKVRNIISPSKTVF